MTIRSYDIEDVVRPRALTYRGTFHQWLTKGVSARRILPTICVHRCNVARVSSQGSRGKDGQHSGKSLKRWKRVSILPVMLPPGVIVGHSPYIRYTPRVKPVPGWEWEFPAFEQIC